MLQSKIEELIQERLEDSMKIVDEVENEAKIIRSFSSQLRQSGEQ